MNLKNVALVFASFLFMSVSFGQKKSNVQVSQTVALKIGTTKPVKDLVHVEGTSSKKKGLWKQTNRPPKDMRFRGLSNVVYPELEHQGPDLIRQKGYPYKKSEVINFLINQDGLDQGSPSDPTGDIGLDYYVQAVNVTRIGVYNKSGELVSQFTGNTLWSPLGFSSAGDPIVLFDQEASRWLITEFPNGNQLLVAVSKTSDPLGAYDVYNFSTPNFPDYPKYAIWPNALTVTTNEQGAGNLHLYAINRDQLLAGEESISIQRIEVQGSTGVESGFLVASPVDWTGVNAPVEGEGPYFVSLDDSSWGNAEMDHMNLWELSLNWEDPTKTEIKETDIETAPFDSYPCKVPGQGFSCIPQPSNVGLDGIPENIMFQPHYRKFDTHESMVMCFVTDVTDGENLAGIRWMELRKTEDTEWSLYQEGTFAPDDELHRFMPSLCIDKFGNIALAYTVSSENVFAGLRVTGRFANDPLGQMSIQETVIVDGTNEIVSGGRFGDYAHMTIDPVDNATFWFTAEYGGNGEVDATTRIASFKLRKEDNDLAVINSLSPEVTLLVGAKEEEFSLEVKNVGINSIDTFYVQYISDNFNSEKVLIDSTLKEDDVFSYTFEEKQLITELGEHEILFVVSSSNDVANLNDTLRRIINVVAADDISVASFKSSSNSLNLCKKEETFIAEVSNIGFDTLKSFVYEVYENENLLNSFIWEGEIAPGKSESIEFKVEGFSNGENTYIFKAKNPNGNEEETVVSNNEAEFTLNVITDSDEVTLVLNFDDYPSETDWKLTNSQGTTLYSGGGYTDIETLEIPLCLSYDECYTFTIFDKFGDGFDGGSYAILNNNGDTLASIIQENFGLKETNTLCPHGGCTLDYDVVVNPTGSSDQATGTIAITVTSGISPFLYSIDGGENYSGNNIFDMLSDGTYNILVKDAGNCKVDTSVSISVVATSDVEYKNQISILPNPNNGYFSMEIQGANYGPKMTYVVLDGSGRQILENSIWKFDDIYKGAVNLTSFPNGNYFIRFENTKLPLAKVIKQ